MSTLSYTIQPDGLYLQVADMWMALTPYTPRTIRVRATLKPEFSAKESLMVEARAAEAIHFAVSETGDSLIFSTAEVTIVIDRQTGAFTYLDKLGALLTREPGRGGKTLAPVDVVVSVFDDSSAVEAGDSADGMRVRAHNMRQVIGRQAVHTKLEFEWAAGGGALRAWFPRRGHAEPARPAPIPLSAEHEGGHPRLGLHPRLRHFAGQHLVDDLSRRRVWLLPVERRRR
jgi:alpha-D-xyloside xylohydrolase